MTTDSRWHTLFYKWRINTTVWLSLITVLGWNFQILKIERDTTVCQLDMLQYLKKMLFRILSHKRYWKSTTLLNCDSITHLRKSKNGNLLILVQGWNHVLCLLVLQNESIRIKSWKKKNLKKMEIFNSIQFNFSIA
mgnify:CR=1 FL=1